MTYATYHNQSLARDVARDAVTAFDSTCVFSAGTAQESIPSFTGQNLFAPLWGVATKKKKYSVSKPIKVHIYSEDDTFFAENETLVVVGTGSSQNEAIDDLGRHIIHFYQYYRKLSWDKVTGDAVRLKKVYETLFVETKQRCQ